MVRAPSFTCAIRGLHREDELCEGFRSYVDRPFSRAAREVDMAFVEKQCPGFCAVHNRAHFCMET